MNNMINVIGLGYIGLPTALMLAANGNDVVGTDFNKKIVESLSRGELTFKEEGLTQLFKSALDSGIKFCTEYKSADIYIIAVPTPYSKLSKKIDMSYVIDAVKSVISVCNDGCIIVIESTVSPGSIDKNIRPLVKKSLKNIRLAHAPERIIPGCMIKELSTNSRTIGTDDAGSAKTLKQVYSSFTKGEIVLTDIRSAEMSKVVENTYRDINIAFANELLKICECAGIDVHEIIRIANRHPRVNILSPGPGVGGHCIAVDPWFLVGDYPGLANIILAARNVNDSMPEYVLKRVRRIMAKENIKDSSRVGLYGITYKENVDDIRESPTLQLLECMRDHVADTFLCYDPYVNEKVTEHQCFSLEEFKERVDMVVIMVAHDEIKQNYEMIKDKIILDTRNCIEEGVYKL